MLEINSETIGRYAKLIDGDTIVKIEGLGNTLYVFEGTFITDCSNYVKGESSFCLNRQSYTLLPADYRPDDVTMVVDAPGKYSHDEIDFIDRALIAAMQGYVMLNNPNTSHDDDARSCKLCALALLTERRSILGKKEGGDD